MIATRRKGVWGMQLHSQVCCSVLASSHGHRCLVFSVLVHLAHPCHLRCIFNKILVPMVGKVGEALNGGNFSMRVGNGLVINIYFIRHCSQLLTCLLVKLTQGTITASGNALDSFPWRQSCCCYPWIMPYNQSPTYRDCHRVYVWETN